MPRELIAIAPRSPVLREYDEPALGPREIRIRSEFASPKHGTELVGYRDDPAAHRPYDPTLGVVMPRQDGRDGGFPKPLGNMAVGVVDEIGTEVGRFQIGDRVFGHFPIRETHTVDEANADPLPPGLSNEAAVCLDPVVMALSMRDAGIGLGDRVVIFGLGAIGLMAVQLARIAGADQVIAVDPIPSRRELASAFGADHVLDPAECGDLGLVIRHLTNASGRDFVPKERTAGERIFGGYRDCPAETSDLGVDVAVEASGSIQALHQAIRATRFGGTICIISFYGSDASGLRLGEEFHINRLRIVSARAESLPMRDAPGWNLSRLVRISLDWLASGRLRVDGIITPVVHFGDCVDEYRAIDEHPERSIKLGIVFP